MSKEHTTSFKIFNYPFVCRIPMVNTMDEFTINEYGTFTSGNETTDMQIATELVENMITIADMAELHKNDVQFFIANPRVDAEKIYSIIVEHLKAWVTRSSVQINGPKPPIEDLILLDSLAAEIYKTSKIFMRSEVVVPKLLSKLQGISLFGGAAEQQFDVPEKHNKITDMINIDRVKRRRDSWR